MSKHPAGYCPVFGNYPKEYNRAIHGPYYPHVNYGPRDTPFGEVKLGELQAWLARRNKTPQAMMAAVSRTWWWWHRRYIETRFGSPSKGYLQLLILFSTSSFLLSYNYYRHERTHKYHW